MATKTRIEVFELQLKLIEQAKKFVKESKDMPSGVYMTINYSLNIHKDEMVETIKYCKDLEEM